VSRKCESPLLSNQIKRCIIGEKSEPVIVIVVLGGPLTGVTLMYLKWVVVKVSTYGVDVSKVSGDTLQEIEIKITSIKDHKQTKTEITLKHAFFTSITGSTPTSVPGISVCP
jgi:hypothetical protein